MLSINTVRKIAQFFVTSFIIILLLPNSSLAQITFERTYGTWAWDWGYSVQQTSDGGYIIAGYHDSGGTGWDLDVYLIKADSLGDTLWTRTYGGPDHDIGFSVGQIIDGGYIIAGAIIINNALAKNLDR